MAKKLDLKEILTPTISLFLICLLTTGALAAVNMITETPIAANMAAKADAARQEIFEDARFTDNGDFFTAMEQNGALLGYCIETQAQGYGGLIEVTVGLDPEGGVLKVKVVNCDNETPGLGQKIKEESFLKQFLGGRDTVQADSIASATYSSQAVVNAVNQALQIYEEQIKGGEAP